MEFYFHLLGRYRVVAQYAASYILAYGFVAVLAALLEVLDRLADAQAQRAKLIEALQHPIPARDLEPRRRWRARLSRGKCSHRWQRQPWVQ
jgi:hypothetical protein